VLAAPRIFSEQQYGEEKRHLARVQQSQMALFSIRSSFSLLELNPT
jgi:hypothetical protein